jgi:hypothetical protein
LAVQPRTVSRTQLIERYVIVSQSSGVLADEEEEGSAQRGGEVDPAAEQPNAAVRDAEQAWWEPVTKMSFDDPEQDPPKYRWRNHVRAQLPVPGLWLTGYKGSSGDVGVFLTGNRPTLERVMDHLGEDILLELPEGSYRTPGRNGVPYLGLKTASMGVGSEDQQRAWISDALNAFANSLRPRLKALPGQGTV